MYTSYECGAMGKIWFAPKGLNMQMLESGMGYLSSDDTEAIIAEHGNGTLNGRTLMKRTKKLYKAMASHERPA